MWSESRGSLSNHDSFEIETENPTSRFLIHRERGMIYDISYVTIVIKNMNIEDMFNWDKQAL